MFGLYPEEDRDVLTEKVRAVLDSVKDDEEVLIASDLFHGTPFNVCVKLSEHYKFEHITGINLPLPVVIIMDRLASNLAQEISNHFLQEAAGTAIYINRILEMQSSSTTKLRRTNLMSASLRRWLPKARNVSSTWTANQELSTHSPNATIKWLRVLRISFYRLLTLFKFNLPIIPTNPHSSPSIRSSSKAICSHKIMPHFRVQLDGINRRVQFRDKFTRNKAAVVGLNVVGVPFVFRKVVPSLSKRFVSSAHRS